MKPADLVRPPAVRCCPPQPPSRRPYPWLRPPPPTPHRRGPPTSAYRTAPAVPPDHSRETANSGPCYAGSTSGASKPRWPARRLRHRAPCPARTIRCAASARPGTRSMLSSRATRPCPRAADRPTAVVRATAGPAGSTPTVITNVVATLRGVSAPESVYVVTGHYDSRISDIVNATGDAPGANDERPGCRGDGDGAGDGHPAHGGDHVFAGWPARSRACSGPPTWPGGSRPRAPTSGQVRRRSAAAAGRRRQDPRTIRLFVEGVPTSERHPRRPRPGSGRRGERLSVAAARPVRPGRSAERRHPHAGPDDLSTRSLPTRQRPHPVPAAGLPSRPLHRAQRGLRPPAPGQPGRERQAVR